MNLEGVADDDIDPGAKGYDAFTDGVVCENAIKFAQRPFLYVILLGLALAFASVPLLLDTTPTRFSCATQLYLVHAAFALVFTTIVAKMWRVMKISQAHVLKKVVLQTRRPRVAYQPPYSQT